MIDYLYILYKKKYSNLNVLSETTLKKIINISLLYCIENLGVNKRKKKELKISYDINPYDYICYGVYIHEENEIRIFKNECIDLDMFCKTFIHEYTHYLQPIRSNYYKLLDIYGYDEHPYEKEAIKNEYIFSVSLLKTIIKNL
jgi:hypothetical protein